MEPVRAILFDFGHTLVDFRRTQEALLEAYRQIRDRVEAVAYIEVPELLDLAERVAGGIDKLVAESYKARRMEELNQADLMRQSFASVGFDLPDDVIEHIVHLDHSAWSNSIDLEPDMRAIVEGLKADGYRIGLVSNVSLFHTLMWADMERLGLDKLLDGAVFSSEFGRRKPDPGIFQEGLKRIGADAKETVFVGDRLYDDVSGAQAVGMRGVQTRQFRQEDDPSFTPDAVIDHLKELPGILEQWGGPPGRAAAEAR